MKVAKTYGFCGLIWHGVPSEPIDYDRSIHDFENSEEYVVSAAIGSAATEGTGSRTEVLVAIPAYNEAETIGEVVTEVRQFADRVVVVDDGSGDDTAERAEQAGARVVVHRRNQGYGGALQTAFEEADRLGVEHLVILDGDGQHDPADVPKLVETQRETGAEIVVGSRFLGDSDVPLYRRFGLFVVNTLTNVGLGAFRPESWIRDTQSGFRAYDADAIRSIAEDDSIGTQMSASTDIIHHAFNRNYSVEEVGTRITYDGENANSQHPLSHGVVLIRNILTLIEQERPIMLIGVPGFVATFVGFGLGYWALTNLFRSGDFPVGLAIASVFFVLAGDWPASRRSSSTPSRSTSGERRSRVRRVGVGGGRRRVLAPSGRTRRPLRFGTRPVDSKPAVGVHLRQTLVAVESPEVLWGVPPILGVVGVERRVVRFETPSHEEVASGSVRRGERRSVVVAEVPWYRSLRVRPRIRETPRKACSQRRLNP
ncbi:glycosyltransferase family 2 protein [Halorussus caseinilyticus]|uniref:Glycosyltransferase family 2 protein n=1 Tax=Halorussus caseinilyticus TaxID=3034025 RepID=A0ABD5WLW4_9EURY